MIPDFQSIMLTLLKSFVGDEIKSAEELRLNMVNHFKMTEEELNAKIPSDKQFALKQNYKIFDIDSDYFIED